MPVTNVETLSSYDEAFALLKENTPEQRLDVQLRYENFLQLDTDYFDLKSVAGISEEQRYPSLAYNSLTQTVTVVTCPIPNTVRNIQLVGSTTQAFPRDDYTRSRKEADGGFIYRTAGSSQVVIAMEVGTSEAYCKLLEDKDMWIDGKGVNVFILICLNESPPFRNPNTEYTDIEGVAAAKEEMAQSLAEKGEANMTQGYYGPLEYRDHMWYGELQEAFIEIWRSDSHRRYQLIQSGFAIARNRLPVTLGIKISDFYPLDEWQVADVEDSNIPFDSARFLDAVQLDMGASAANRFERYLYENWGYAKRTKSTPYRVLLWML
ncbi:hypothetical protein V1509DRAFT_654855 [Lipomyces kononenkoae]